MSIRYLGNKGDYRAVQLFCCTFSAAVVFDIDRAAGVVIKQVQKVVEVIVSGNSDVLINRTAYRKSAGAIVKISALSNFG